MFRHIIHLLSFFFKEVNEILRQPRLVASLILGPFIVLLLFGMSYSGAIPDFRFAIVVPPNLTDEQVSRLRASAENNFTLVSLDSDEEGARARLRRGEVDIVEVLPADMESKIEQGLQSHVSFIYSEINPFDESWVRYLGDAQTNEMNRALLETSIAEVQQESPALPNVSPQLVVSPLKPSFENMRGQSMSFVNYYAPSVLALILQHIAITLGALSIVRERERGTLEMFRVSPVTSGTIILGKYLGYFAFLALLSAGLVGVLALLGTPIFGSPWTLAGLIALLIVASLGIGFLISCISNSDSTAVQLSMLVLLISIFFCGFFLPLENFTPIMQTLASFVPLTHGIKALQDIMLKGIAPAWFNMAALGGIAIAAFLLVQLLFKRQMKRLKS